VNALTKTFVVLVTILSVVLVSLVVPYVANQENYREQRDAALRTITSLETNAKTLQAEINALKRKESQRLQNLRTQNKDLDQLVEQLRSENAAKEGDLNEAQAKADQAASTVQRLSASSNQQTEILQLQQTELNDLRKQRRDLQTRNIQAADRINDLQSQVESLTQQFRSIQERMVELNIRNDELESIWRQVPPDVKDRILGRETDTLAKGPAGTIEPEIPIRGQITEVRPFSNELIVQINVGANDEVTENMKFYIHRGDDFVGTLVVDTVDAQSSAGRVNLSTQEVRVGDSIFTGGI
jgi:myosin heavy subunit